MNQQNDGQGQFAGQGGSYVVGADGEHRLIERTRAPGEDPAPPAEPPTLTEVVTHEQPADAGFFSPDAPAEQSTPTE
jgi:hypothetical protein